MIRIIAISTVILLLAIGASAHDLGARAPVKPSVCGTVAPPPDPDVIRQGGDTLADAILLAVPGSATGTTAGYTNDYDEACPYSTSIAPDVVYKMAPAADIVVDIDMYGSAYDTKIYVYREDMTLVACNDDFYSDYVSKLEEVALAGDTKYFLVIDGYGEEAGEYVVDIVESVPCVVDCWAGAQLEGEPELVDGYVDEHNGGCNTEGSTPFGTIWSYLFCGVSGWYLSAEGEQYRDTDWFELYIPSSGYLEIIGDAEYATYMFELGPQDCDDVAVIQSTVIGPCEEGSMTITGDSGSTVWFWVGPTIYDGPVHEYNYVIMSNYWNEPAVQTEAHSWSSVKSLFDQED